MGKTLAESCFGNVLSNDLLPDFVYEQRASNQIILHLCSQEQGIFFNHGLFCCSPPLSQNLVWKWVAFPEQWD